MIKQTMIGVALAAGMTATASGQIAMQEIQRIDLFAVNNADSATFIGTNVSAIAWNGSELYMAGFNAGGAAGTGIARHANGSFERLQFISGTPGSTGFSGLSISGNRLVASYDTGAANAQGFQLFDLSNDSVVWSRNIRGSSGIAFDPGFGGADSGVAYTAFGSGRRALIDTETGNDIYTTANGMIITPGGGTLWRSLDFAGNGDMVGRKNNDLVYVQRTGGNSGSPSFLFDAAANNQAGDFVNGQNVAFVDNSFYGDFVIWNNRSSAGVGQSAADVLRVTDLNGNQLSLDLSLIGGGSLADSNGFYDFSWDAASGTLAVVDFFNRNVHIFAVPAPGAAGLLGMAGLLAARRRR